MSEWIPTPKAVVKFAISLIALMTVAQLLGVQNWLFNPVTEFKTRFGK